MITIQLTKKNADRLRRAIDIALNYTEPPTPDPNFEDEVQACHDLENLKAQLV